MKNVFINPVLNKEFKLRFRSLKTFMGLMFYLLAIGVIVIGFILLTSWQSGATYFRPEESRGMFMMLSFIQLSMVLFITPGLTAGVISGEREKQTLNILLTTIQSSTSIILGKLFSSVSYLILLIIASLPIYSFVFLFGGVSPMKLLQIMSFYLFTVFAFGSIGIMFSTLFRKTIISMVTTYGISLFLTAGTFFFFTIAMQFSYGNSGGQSPFTYYMAMLNPLFVLFSLLEPFPMEEIKQMTGIEFPLLLSYMIAYSILIILCIGVSIRKLRPRMKK
ncbi:ABC transporter permease [Bacillus sp. 2205SS5-2]|uniref:ABC transporter permease n=1 Tax=Bacillus sp. 2205SS5-2 TaxID=3109031 RepID=UPI003005607C